MSSIEWTGETWNPITGCTRISPGCQHCYAERMAARLKRMGQAQYQNVVYNGKWTGQIRFVSKMLDKPLRKQKPTTYFVNSMSDLFHKDAKVAWLDRVWWIMANCPQHAFQILTKRAELLPERVGAMVELFGVLPNVWIGASVENENYTWRIEKLRRTMAAIRFLSIEPLLGQVDISYHLKVGIIGKIDWVIVGGESGPGARPMKAEWARDIRDQCVAAGVPFFFKQWGGVNKKKAGRVLDGRTWDEMPGGFDGTTT